MTRYVTIENDGIKSIDGANIIALEARVVALEAFHAPPPDPGAFDPITSLTLTNSDLTAAGIDTNWQTVKTLAGKTTGKYSVEYTLGSGLTSNDTIFGILQATTVLNGQFLGQAATAYGYYGGNGNKTNNGLSAYGTAYSSSAVIRIELDLDNHSIEFFLNNVSQGVAFAGLPTVEFFIGASHKLGANGTVNLGATAFVDALTSGFSSWDGSQTG